MTKPLPTSDHRALRHYLEGGDFGVQGVGDAFKPVGKISASTWKNLVGLPDSVAIETSDDFATELERMDALSWSWLEIHDSVANESPLQYQTLAALETFQASVFNALCGWYRIAGSCLRFALEDILLGLYFQDLPAERSIFDAITDGKTQASPRFGTVLKALKHRGLSDELDSALRMLYHEVLSIYVHLRSDGNIWESNGPVYVPGAFRTWMDEYETTYLVICELIDSLVPGSGALTIAQAHARANFRCSNL